jgi:hypothetical protein
MRARIQFIASSLPGIRTVGFKYLAELVGYFLSAGSEE